MATWVKQPFRYTLIGLEQGSAAKPYEIVRTKDLRDDREWVSCNCPSYIRGRQNKGLQQWERSCKHTKRYSVDAPEIDFAGDVGATWVDEPVKGERIPFQKPQLPARWQDKYEVEVFDNPDWLPTVKMDGHRCLVIKQPYGKVEMFSRGGKRMMSVEPAFQDLQLSKGTMLDTELVVGDLSVCNCPDRSGQRQAFESVAHFRAEHPEALGLVVLDVLFVDGKSVMSSLYHARRMVAEYVVTLEMADERVKMVEMKPKDVSTEDWLVSIRNRGAEGAVFWNKNEPYRPGIRSSTAMLKKKWGRVHDVDVVVVAVLPPTEKTPGHRLAYGYADGKQLGVVPGVRGSEEELKQYVGQVVELKAHEILTSGSLLYPELVRFRPDKDREECTHA